MSDYYLDYKGPWEEWFAWFPVEDADNKTLWFKKVYRRKYWVEAMADHYTFAADRWEYRENIFDILKHD